MEYTGLYLKYPANRLLTQQERDTQLRTDERLELVPTDQLSVIRLNSTYLELVDKYFSWKGFMSGFMLVCICLFLFMSLSVSLTRHWDMFWGIPAARPAEDLEWVHELGFFLVFGLISNAIFFWILRKESFAYTHYPVRYNRQTRMVHVFRLDGTVLSASWDSLFFCLGSLRQGNWEIQGHVLADDGVTVTETFCAFPQVAGSEFEREQLKEHWEFIRRYMENGSEDAYQRTKICLPIADRREKVSFGFHRMFAEGTGNLFTLLIAAVFGVAIMPGRWFAMQTSKIPQWPAEIEAVNRIEPGDPFVRDASMNEKWKELPDIVWLAISALFWAVVIYWVSGLEPWH